MELAVSNLCIMRRGLEQILLINRERSPYQGYWGMPGGKINDGERLDLAGARELREETGIIQKPRFPIALCYERIFENGKVKYVFHINFFKFVTRAKVKKKSDEGELRWFDISDLPEKIIPSDPKMIHFFAFNGRDYARSDIIKEDDRYALKIFFDEPHDYSEHYKRWEAYLEELKVK